MAAPEAPTSEELHALADGRVDGARRAAIEAWLATHPEDAARVADYRRIDAELHALFDPVMAEPVPTGWARRRRHTALARIAAALLLLGIGGAGGWFAHGLRPAPDPEPPLATPAPPLAIQAANAHAVYVVEVRHPVEVVAAEEAHLVTWLSRRMGQQIKAPKLYAEGYRLVGGRLLPAAEGGVACQLMYETPAGQRITLFIKPPMKKHAETAFRYAVDKDGNGTFYWVDQTLGYALTGQLEREELLRLARLVYEQLSG